MGTIEAIYVVLANGRVGPAWNLETAVQAAHEAESGGGLRAIQLEQGGKIILPEAALREAISRLRVPYHVP